MREAALIVGLTLGLSFLATPASGETTWGDLSASFVFDGKAPLPKKLELNKDIEVCMRKHPVSEELLVNPKNNGIANVVVYVELKKPRKLPGIHPSYSKPRKVRITNKNCRFEPHITAIRAGEKVELGNDDPIHHNILGDLIYNAPFNTAIQPSSSITQVFSRIERKPRPLSCPIHSWMRGYLIVKDHPYVGIADVNGKLTIKNLPTGKWAFQFWHEKAGYLKEIRLGTGTLEDKKGIHELEIKPGKNDLGAIKLAASVFE